MVKPLVPLFLSKGMPEWIETVETVLRATLTSRAVDAPDPAPHEGSLDRKSVV